jgi:hypothetical protein
LPLPEDRTELLALGHQGGPDLDQDAVDDEALEPAVHRGVGAEAARQLVPLAAGAHAVDDAVEDEAKIGAGPAGAGRRITAVEDRLDPLPELVGELPDRRQRALGGRVGNRQGTLLLRGMCLAVQFRAT